MKRIEIVRVAVIVLVASTLSGLVAYRLALHHGMPAFKPSGDASAGCVDFRDAGSRAGETSCVTGRVLRVFTSRGGNSFLDFCSDYRQCPFTSVIFSSDHDKFGNLEMLQGRQVEIRGEITNYQGRAEIIIRDPDQIRLAP